MTPTIVPTKFTAIDALSAKVKAMNSSVSRFAEDFSHKFDAAGKTAFKLGRQTAIMGAVIAAPLVVAAKSAVDFEAKMSNVATLIDTSKESISKMGDQVLQLATKLPVPIEELTTSLYDIRSAGISASKQFETLDSAARLSVAGLSSVSEATNISTSALNAFKTEGLSAAQTNDILFKTVKYGKTTISDLSTGFGATAGTIQSAGVKLADFSAATAALTTVGTPATQAQTQLRAAIVALQKPTAEMDRIFKKLGVTSEKELIKKEGGIVGAFDAINNAGTAMGLNLSKAWSSSEATAAVTSLTGATKDTYLKAMDDMVNGSNALDGAFNKQQKTGKASMQTIKNNMEALSITIGQALIPVISDLVSTVSPYINAASKWIQNNKGLVTTIVKVTAGIAALAFGISAAAFAIGIYKKAMVVAEYASKLFTKGTSAMTSTMGMAVIAIGLAVAAFKTYNFVNREAMTSDQLANDLRLKSVGIASEQIAQTKLLFMQLKNSKQGTDEYRSALTKIDQMSPGLVAKYNLQEKSLRGLALAEDDLRTSIMRRAKEQAAQQMVQSAEKKVLELEAKVNATKGQSAVSEFFQGFGDYENTHSQLVKSLEIAKKERATVDANFQAGSGENAPANAGPSAMQKIDLWINGQQQGNMNDLSGKKIDAPFSFIPSIPNTK